MGEVREMVVVHVGDSCVCGRQSQEGGRSVVVSIIRRCVDMQLCDYRETIVSVRISCDSGIAIKIFTHESATTAENLYFILILYVFICGRLLQPWPYSISCTVDGRKPVICYQQFLCHQSCCYLTAFM